MSKLSGKLNEYGLTEMQESMAQAYVKCMGAQSDAYLLVHPNSKAKPTSIAEIASTIYSKPQVLERISILQKEAAKRNEVTIDTITSELNEAIVLSKETQSASSMTGAIMSKAKIHGLVTDKKKVNVSGTINLSSMTDQQLLDIINDES